MGLMTAERARNHPERSMLVRSLGRELIVSIDRITMPLVQGDRLILCSDGLHNVLLDDEESNPCPAISTPRPPAAN